MKLLDHIKNKYELSYPTISAPTVGLLILDGLKLSCAIIASFSFISYTLSIYFYSSTIFPNGFALEELPITADLKGYMLYVTFYFFIKFITIIAVKLLKK